MKDKKAFLLFSFLAVGLLAFNVVFAFTGPGTGQTPGSGGGILFSSSTFIGIGTTNPTAKIHIYGSSYTAAGLTDAYNSPFFRVQTQGAASNSSIFMFNVGSNIEAIQGAYSTSGASALSINPFGGYVGIATSSPGYPLTVHGNIFTDGSFIGSLSGNLSAANVSGPAAFGSNYGTYNYAMPGSLAVGTTTVAGLPSALYVAGDIKLADGNSRTITGPLSTSFTIDGYQTTMKVSRNSDPSFMLQSKNSGGTYVDRFNLGASGVDTAYAYFSNSNVGIGTTTPTTRLYVLANGTQQSITAGTQYSAIRIKDTDSGASPKLGISWARADADYTIAAIEPQVFAGWSTDLKFLTNTDGASQITEKMRITAAGKVGIGTTTPGSYMLYLNDSGANTLALDSPSVPVQRFRVGGSDIWGFLPNYGPSNGFAFFNYNNSSVTMQFTSTGLVGIATTTPQYKLSVNGSYYSVEVDKGNSGTAITIDWSAGNTQHIILTSGPATPVALTFTNPQPGARYTLILKQDGTGGRTVTWPATFRIGSAGPITLSSAPNATDYIGLQYNGVDGKYDNVAFNAGF